MIVQIEETFEATWAAGVTGLVGSAEVAILDNQGNQVFGPTSSGIIELDVGGIPIGVYSANLVAPSVAGQYSIVWTPDGSWAPISTSTPEDLFVAISAILPSPLPDPGGGSLAVGPCTAWTIVDEVAACCSVEISSDSLIFEDSITTASELLWALSGRQFTGLCSKTVRPCSRNVCGVQVLSRGHLVIDDFRGWSGSSWGVGDSQACGCHPLDRIKLSGYPVREITQVLIDGDVVDPDTYRLDDYRWLTRVRDPDEPDIVLGWPSCQALDLPTTENGTFSVTYTYGVNPPALGVAAAGQLACELYKLCAGETDCALPAGTTRATRQGLTIEKTAVLAWFFSKQIGGWSTGMSLVDAFLAMTNPSGLVRRAVIWGPDAQEYAR